MVMVTVTVTVPPCEFNPILSYSACRDSQGSGLGLFIAKQLVILHHGTLSAVSAGENKGSEFSLTIPAFVLRSDVEGAPTSFTAIKQEKVPMSPYPITVNEKETNGEHSSEACKIYNKMRSEDIEMGKMTHETSASPSPSYEYVKPSSKMEVSQNLDRYNSLMHAVDSSASVDLMKLTVLIVDDVSSTRKIMARMLRGKVLKSFQAQDGQECVDLVTAGTDKIDIILLDFEMPVMNGT